MQKLNVIAFFIFGLSLGYFAFKFSSQTNNIQKQTLGSVLVNDEQQSGRNSSTPPLDKAQCSININPDNNSLISSLKEGTEEPQRQPKKHLENPKIVGTSRNNKELIKKQISYLELRKQFSVEMEQRMQENILEVSDDHFQDLQSHFLQAYELSEWSSRYQDKLMEYIHVHNIDGEHAINFLQCKESICRLEISSNNEENWHKVISGIIQQEWYNTLAYTTLNEDPTNFVYLFPKYDR